MFLCQYDQPLLTFGPMSWPIDVTAFSVAALPDQRHASNTYTCVRHVRLEAKARLGEHFVLLHDLLGSWVLLGLHA